MLRAHFFNLRHAGLVDLRSSFKFYRTNVRSTFIGRRPVSQHEDSTELRLDRRFYNMKVRYPFICLSFRTKTFIRTLRGVSLWQQTCTSGEYVILLSSEEFLFRPFSCHEDWCLISDRLSRFYVLLRRAQDGEC